MKTRVEESWQVIPADSLEPDHQYRLDEKSKVLTVLDIQVTETLTTIDTVEGEQETYPAFYQVEYLQRRIVKMGFFKWLYFKLRNLC